MSRSSTIPLIVAFSLANNAAQLGLATFPALMPAFIAEWQLSNTEAGWINGIFFAGYLSSVLVLVSLTDRMSARKIYFLCMILIALTSAGFAILAEGFWSAMTFRFMAGVGMAGTYMPGLKLLSDHLKARHGDKDQSRAVAFYVSNFGVGMAISFFVSGLIATTWDWHWAYATATIGPILSMAMTAWALPDEDPAPTEKPDTHLLDFRPVLRCRAAMGYVLAYTAHNFELFAFRSWIVAYLTFAAATGPTGNMGWSATAIAAIINLLGLPASIMGNEVARRFGRHRTITIVMLSSAVVACVLGFSAHWPFWAVVGLSLVYGAAIVGDSAAITAGVLAAAPKGYSGATMAMHSSIGFLGAFAGPLAFGVMLDLTGPTSGATGASWGWAFVMAGAVACLGPVALKLLGEKKA
ncbi:MAG: MFS transporter [Rhodospirillales bacterium]|nr:MFS transporter [Rhodospirillales bacterium]